MQFYLDMEFVMLFSSQGRYLSRHLNQVIKNIIARAIDAVSATGLDPFRCKYNHSAFLSMWPKIQEMRQKAFEIFSFEI